MVGGGTGEVGVLGVADSAEDRLKPEFSSITLLSCKVGVVNLTKPRPQVTHLFLKLGNFCSEDFIFSLQFFFLMLNKRIKMSHSKEACAYK